MSQLQYRSTYVSQSRHLSMYMNKSQHQNKYSVKASFKAAPVPGYLIESVINLAIPSPCFLWLSNLKNKKKYKFGSAFCSESVSTPEHVHEPVMTPVDLHESVTSLGHIYESVTTPAYVDESVVTPEHRHDSAIILSMYEYVNHGVIRSMKMTLSSGISIHLYSGLVRRWKTHNSYCCVNAVTLDLQKTLVLC